MADILKLKKKAADFEAKKQMDKALDVYRDIVQAYEDGNEDSIDIPLYNRVGDMLQKAGNLPEAVSVWEKAVDHYTEGGFFNPAIALCNKILRASPGRTVIYYKLGKIHAEKGFKGDARQNFLEYASRQQKAGNLDDAFKALKEFAELVPDQYDVRLMLADQLVKASRKDEAIAQLQLGFTQASADGNQAAADDLAAKMKEIDPSVEPTAAARGESSGGGGLVFLDLDDGAAPAPARKSANPTPLNTKRASRAIEGLALISVDPIPEPPTMPSKETRELAKASELLIEPTDVGADAPPPPRGSLMGLEVTNLADEMPTPAELPMLEVETSAVEQVPVIEIELPVESVPLIDLEPTAAAEIPLIDFDGTPAGGISLIEPEPSIPADASGLQVDLNVTGDIPLISEEPSFGGDLPMLDVEPSIGGDLPLLSDEQTESIEFEPLADAPIGASADATLESFGSTDELELIDDAVADSVAESAPLIESTPVFAGTPEAVEAALREAEGGATADVEAVEETIVDELVELDVEPSFGAEVEPEVEPVVEAAVEAAVEPIVEPEVAAVVDVPLLEDMPASTHLSVDDLRERVEAAADDFGVRRQYAEALLESGDRVMAMRELEAAMSGYEQQGDLDTAGSIAEEIVRLEPKSIRYHQKRVEFAFRANDRARLAEAYVELADALLADGQGLKARAVYQRVLDIKPDDLRAQAAIESIPLEEEPAPAPPRRSTTVSPRPAAASVPEAPVAPKPKKDDEEEYVSLGDWLREDDEPKSTRMVVDEQEPTGDEAADFADMLRKFKQGVSDNVEEEDHEAHYDLGVAYKEMGLLDEAISEFQKALRGTSERTRAFEALGHCFIEKGQLPVAATIMLRALAEPGVRDESLVGVLYLLGTIAEEQGQFADAKKYYERVFSVDIQFRDVGDRLNAVEQRQS